MEAEDLYRLMDDPSLLSEETLSVLKQMVDEYPYFQTARILYLKNLAVLGDIRFLSELKKMTIYIPDRKKLFALIEGERYGLQAMLSLAKQKGMEDDSFSLIEEFLSTNAGENQPPSGTSLLFEPSASSDYIFWSLTKGEEAPAEDLPAVKFQHHDLIDSFIKNEEQRVPGSGLNIPQPDQTDEPAAPVEEPDENQLKSLDDSYFTETLAHIYVKQKRYDKALQIIKNLSLKYPEKNIYFADQTRFLEKLIINTKK